MGKFDGILICTDLDGTLYKNDKTISKENKDAIDYFKREGGYFTFITGRMPYYSTDAYNAASPNVPFGCNNGGAIFDGETGKYVWATELSRSSDELIAHIEKNFDDFGIQVCGLDRTYFSKEHSTTERFRQRTGVPKLLANYKDIGEPVGKIIFSTDSEEKLFAIAKALREHPRGAEFDFVRSERTLFEILPKGVNKGLALEKLTEHLGVDKRRSIGIGDYDNDVGLFQAAGIGIAVANACQAAKDAADFVTVSNEEHALSQVITDIENGKYGF